MNRPPAADIEVTINDLARRRWSPYAYESRSLEPDDVRALFEAARWAPSSMNEQPWRYIFALRDDREEFEKALSCLVEGNRKWARYAGALIFTVAKRTFSRNDKPNRYAWHDVGQASFSLAIEAVARGLAAHQMGGILPDRVAEVYGVPEGYEVVSGIAVGYPGTASDVSTELAERDQKRRPRRPAGESVFARKWGQTHSLFA